MKFSEILTELDNGKVVRRHGYNSAYVVFKQIPASIPNDAVCSMKSLPQDMKCFLCRNSFDIDYQNQYILYDCDEETATYMIFDGDDINADDWYVIDPLNYDTGSL